MIMCDRMRFKAEKGAKGHFKVNDGWVYARTGYNGNTESTEYELVERLVKREGQIIRHIVKGHDPKTGKAFVELLDTYNLS